MNTLVIGYGNTLRSDDGVGPLIAQQIAQWKLPQVRSLAVHQLTPELASEISNVNVVCFVDAWSHQGGDHPHVCKLERLIPEPSPTQMNHHWSPSLLLHLTQTLYHRQPQAYHLYIPAINFDYSETLSPCAQQGVSWAVQTIQRIVSQERCCYA